jgi:hypothetical protein
MPASAGIFLHKNSGELRAANLVFLADKASQKAQGYGNGNQQQHGSSNNQQGIYHGGFLLSLN